MEYFFFLCQATAAKLTYFQSRHCGLTYNYLLLFSPSDKQFFLGLRELQLVRDFQVAGAMLMGSGNNLL